MGIIIGYLVRIVTFPGLILDALINKATCSFLHVKVLKVDYFSVGTSEAVMHEKPEKYSTVFSIAIIPFVVMSLIAMFIFYIGKNLSPTVELLCIWLGISVAAHAFPNTKTGGLLWSNSFKEIKEGNYFAIIGLPLVIIIFVARILHVLWLDIIYGVLLYFFIKEGFKI